ncbi:MAG: hypothetical protein MI742_02335 [Desulfobacterales bacterium]|nr:hypothetical protein [Desulfobacterales bacterium]
MGTIIRIRSDKVSCDSGQERRFGLDRRAPFERRKGYGAPVMTEGDQKECRQRQERRSSHQRRFGWRRMGRWSSDCTQGPA